MHSAYMYATSMFIISVYIIRNLLLPHPYASVESTLLELQIYYYVPYLEGQEIPEKIGNTF